VTPNRFRPEMTGG